MYRDDYIDEIIKLSNIIYIERHNCEECISNLKKLVSYCFLNAFRGLNLTKYYIRSVAETSVCFIIDSIEFSASINSTFTDCYIETLINDAIDSLYYFLNKEVDEPPKLTSSLEALAGVEYEMSGHIAAEEWI